MAKSGRSTTDDGVVTDVVEGADTPTLQTLRTGLRAVTHLAEAGGGSLADVAAHLDLTRSSAYRILRTLREAGWVRLDNGRYELASGAYVAGISGLRLFHRTAMLRNAVATVMQRLVHLTTETVTLSVVSNARERIVVEQAVSPREIRMTVELGRRWPLYAGASGQAILAAFDEGELARYLASVTMTPLTGDTLDDPGAIREKVEKARQDGFVVSVGERQVDAFSVAAPIVEPGGAVVGAMAVCGPRSRYAPEPCREYGSLLIVETERLVQELSGSE